MASTEQRSRAEWLEQRRGGIGGSDAAALFGVHPWMSKYTLYLDKIGELPEADYKAHLEVGNALEPLTRELFTRRTGLEVEPNTENIHHPAYPWMRCTVDGYLEGRTVNFEGKTTTIHNADDWADGKVPLYYQVQCTHYMICTSVRKSIVAVLILGREDPLEVREIEYNEAFANALIEAERRFWIDHVLARVPPEIDGHPATTSALTRMHRKDSGRFIELGDDATEWMDEIIDLSRQVVSTERRIQRLKNLVMSNMEDATWAATQDGRGWSWRTQGKAGAEKRVLRKHTEKAMTRSRAQAKQIQEEMMKL